MDPQRPVRGRNAPARPHDRHANGARVRGYTRAPRGRRRLRAGKPPPGSRTLDEEGVDHPADAPRRRDARVTRRRGCATRTSGAATSARSSPEIGSPRGASPSSARGAAAIASLRRWTSSSRTRSASSARRSASFPTAASKARTCSRRASGLLEIRAAVTIAGDSIDIDFEGTAPQYDGQPQLPARRDPLGVLLRRALPDRPRRSRLGRRVRPRDASARPRAVSSTRARRQPSRPGTRRPRAGSRTSSSTPSRRRCPVPAQGQGTMNNTVFGNDRFTYYETIGGGQGACPDADGPSGGARRDVEHASTRPPRRSSSRTRCASSATSSGSARAGAGCTAAATAWFASCASSSHAGSRSSRSVERLLPRGARGGADGLPRPQLPERRGAAGYREPRPRGQATSSGSRRPAAAAGASRRLEPVEREPVVRSRPPGRSSSSFERSPSTTTYSAP